jgi:hypothetical protein
MVIAVLLYIAGEVMHLKDSKPIIILMCSFEIPWLRTFLDYRYSYTDTYVI